MDLEEDNICKCCGNHYGPIPIGAWMSYINGWHTVYIKTPNDQCTALAYDNDPAKAAKDSWEKLEKMCQFKKLNHVTANLVGIKKSLEIGKVVEIDLSSERKQFIYFEEMKDGKWRLTYTKETIPEIKKLESIDIVRGK